LIPNLFPKQAIESIVRRGLLAQATAMAAERMNEADFVIGKDGQEPIPIRRCHNRILDR
jgi:hypothetical protein